MTTAEDSSPSPAPRKSGLHLAVWVAFLLLIIYPLSVGPVAKVCPSPPPALRQFYAPLGFICDRFPAAKNFYDWYGKLWGVKF